MLYFSDKPLKRLLLLSKAQVHPDESWCYPKYSYLAVEIAPCFSMVLISIPFSSTTVLTVFNCNMEGNQ